MRQRKENEKESQQTQMDAEMAQMMQSNRENTKACNTAMATMSAKAQRQMDRRMAEHNANIEAIRRVNDGVEVERNERVNVVKLANAQRLMNMKQRLDAQCSDLRPKQRAG